jgi:hypothetical protein
MLNLVSLECFEYISVNSWPIWMFLGFKVIKHMGRGIDTHTRTHVYPHP